MEHAQTVRKFSELNIQPEYNNFVGKKIEVEEILNKEIRLMAFRVEESKYKDTPKYSGNGKCLCLQIQYEGQMRVVFTGSVVLQGMIARVAEFPVDATIVKEGKAFKFI